MADFPDGLRQPDQRSCGAACLVAAHGLRNPGYEEQVDSQTRFSAEVLAMHRRVTSPSDVAGRMQLPWPRMFGTPPWAVERQLAASWDRPYATQLVRGTDRAATFARLAGAAAPAGLYVGSGWLPRHVVLVLDGDDEALRVYEPAGGRVERVDRDRFTAGELSLGGWDVAWFVIVPDVTR
ncbi:hypothetical protein [Nocardioides coralli]|uniref:hypothetical protein n=1 Tax=Nocardioides coralli TaxID=2872154 RepID=UPI001CA3C96A|nr:hypothetical protein [Nocardioides coralli]QZY29932.1 hypothetical protein K6T13_04390 [Nocardioides coralli]